QLRDGVPNFFAVFIEVLKARDGGKLQVEPGVTTGDYLSGFLYGTRKALFEGGRGSITLTIDRVDERSVGMLIALFERAVGFYGFLVNINAYHQPGVEAGKKAAQSIIEMQGHILKSLESSGGEAISGTAEEISVKIGSRDKAEDVFHILLHLAANGRVASQGHGVDAVFSLAE
ncbi:MAG TPA: hypothetical protein VF627_14125, partial [Abditibacterium sp.]